MVTSEIGDLTIRIDGRRPLSPELVTALQAVCAKAEDEGGRGPVLVHVSGSPEESPDEQLSVGLVSKWERGLRRLERVPALTIAMASGDCGGVALDALLAADYRIATAPVRLLVPVDARGTWPGMALHRLVQQAGVAAVRRAVLLGVPIEADDALALHLIDELAPNAASMLTAAAKLAVDVVGTELAIRRQLMLDASVVGPEEALGAHLAACDRTLRQSAAGAVGMTDE